MKTISISDYRESLASKSGIVNSWLLISRGTNIEESLEYDRRWVPVAQKYVYRLGIN